MPRERILKRLAFVSGLSMLGILIFGSLVNEPRRAGEQTAADQLIPGRKYVNTRDKVQPRAIPLTTKAPLNPDLSGPSELDTALGQYVETHAPDWTLVLLLSYQRSGSSFIGDSLFNINPDSFFIYEPLDQVYSAMYGASQGWTVPADITTNADGSLRVPPNEELEAVSWMMDVLLTCNMSTIPLEIYLHGFWRQQLFHMNSLKTFVHCMQGTKALGKLETCHNHLKRVCGRKFNERGRKQDICLKRLWQHDEDQSVKLKPKELQSFEAYRNCIERYREKVTPCIPHFQSACSSHSLHAMKTVRATMRSAEPLLQKYPNFKVIHLYRDPRAVVLSRKKASWARGRYDRKGELHKIARLYCQTVLEDDRRRRDLEMKYPGRLMKLEYGDYFKDPKAALHEVYQFLHLPVNSLEFVKDFNNKTRSRDSEEISTKWQREFTPDHIETIEKECETFATETGFNWH